MPINWTESMTQTFEFWEVDPYTWNRIKKINNIVSCSISRDISTETKENASLECIGNIDECYIRPILTPVQNGIKYEVPLGTFLVQTPGETFNGKFSSYSIDAYSPLIELKEKYPPLGYTIPKNTNIMKIAVELVKENMRSPVVSPGENAKILDADYIANPDDTWLSFIIDLIAKADMSIELDDTGQVIFVPSKETSKMQPKWTYDDSNSSILLPNINIQRDLYGIPNVLEVYYTGDNSHLYSKVVNDEEDSPISTINRGREIMQRDTSPSLSGNPTQEMLDEYAERSLRSLSTLEYHVSYTHGYTPTRVNDCVRLNYVRANLNNVNVRVLSQQINCNTGITVSETSIYTNRYYKSDLI